MNSENYWVEQLLLKVYLFSFHFISALQYLDYYDNEYSMKQTASLYLK